MKRLIYWLQTDEALILAYLAVLVGLVATVHFYGA